MLIMPLHRRMTWTNAPVITIILLALNCFVFFFLQSELTFTMAHAVRFSQIEPARIVWGMFLHASVGHLLGNMLFLLMLGLLVEGALGPWWFLALYVAGGFGAALTSQVVHWGSHGFMLGASGAIAALMGAYCVLWGLRKVRVFYWFFIVFDYVRVPALVLLPLWLGWQLFSLLVDRNAHVAFGAHAGGIVCGAVLAWVLRRCGCVRLDFVEQDEREHECLAAEAHWQQAMAHIGRLEIANARALLKTIDANQPGQLRVQIALYRCARYDGSASDIDAALARLLDHHVKSDQDIRAIKTACDDYLKSAGGASKLAPGQILRLVEAWSRIREDDDIEALLHSAAENAPSLPDLARAWFAFALHAPETSSQRHARLRHLQQHFPHSPWADKATFLLQEA